MRLDRKVGNEDSASCGPNNLPAQLGHGEVEALNAHRRGFDRRARG